MKTQSLEELRMLSMIIILCLLAVTILLLIGRFFEILLNRYRERTLALSSRNTISAPRETCSVDYRAA